MAGEFEKIEDELEHAAQVVDEKAKAVVEDVEKFVGKEVPAVKAEVGKAETEVVNSAKIVEADVLKEAKAAIADIEWLESTAKDWVVKGWENEVVAKLGALKAVLEKL